MSATRAVRDWFKRSRTVHSGYKLLRMTPQLSLREWAQPHRTISIFRVLPNTMLPAKRLVSAYDIMVTVEREELPGDVAECGVWSGGGIGLLALASRHASRGRRRFHLFDSFAGLPAPSSEDENVLENFRRAHPEGRLNDGRSALNSIGACQGADAASVKHFLTEGLGLEAAQLVFHEGWFQDTVPLAGASIEALSILRLDGDWYESTKVCLDNLYDRVVAGGFLIIDDYGTFTGCRQAVDEFAEQRGIDKSRFIDVDGECIYFRK